MDNPIHLLEFESMLLSRYQMRRGRPGLERSAYVVLNRLTMQGPMSIGQLSAAFGLDTSTLNRQTATMVRAGLVERIADPDGGVARKFRITAAGTQQLEQTVAATVASLNRILQEWSAEDVENFARYLRRLNTDIERLDGRPWPRPGIAEVVAPQAGGGEPDTASRGAGRSAALT
ncbi:MarR family winged helix-turn-helix transcriptional regulator [Nocardia vermiculata]|uniref:MarR family transcriptional regulator n=1 Tax=Nocardia vermiculata TaxID=257274 RepID=A0A846XYN8_9NOCA|nr:MarR family transcriptional regulator [Nocardia vermiculata]NKY50895.1 MarR family transcriptional regulator [Nocardia vermiculata]